MVCASQKYRTSKSDLAESVWVSVVQISRLVSSFLASFSQAAMPASFRSDKNKPRTVSTFLTLSGFFRSLHSKVRTRLLLLQYECCPKRLTPGRDAPNTWFVLMAFWL